MLRWICKTDSVIQPNIIGYKCKKVNSKKWDNLKQIETISIKNIVNLDSNSMYWIKYKFRKEIEKWHLKQ